MPNLTIELTEQELRSILYTLRLRRDDCRKGMYDGKDNELPNFATYAAIDERLENIGNKLMAQTR